MIISKRYRYWSAVLAEIKYIRSLDGLRAVAVLAVVLSHLSHSAFPGGAVGVDIFFVLSGFLITSVLRAEYAATGAISLRLFYFRRVLRLWPALWLAAGIITLAAIFTGAPSPHPGIDALAATSFTMNFVRIWSHISEVSPLGHTWSLAVEDQFYLLWPLCLLGLFRLPLRRRLVMLGAMILLVELWKLALALDHAPVARLNFGSDTRADQLLVGCLLCLWWNDSASPRAQAVVARGWPIGCIVLAALARFGLSDRSLTLGAEYALAAVASAVIIAQLLRSRLGLLSQLLSLPPMVYIGKLSYGIYLWHYALLVLVRFHSPNRMLAVSAVAGSFVMAALSYHLLEKPILRFKEHFSPISPAASLGYLGGGRIAGQAMPREFAD